MNTQEAIVEVELNSYKLVHERKDGIGPASYKLFHKVDNEWVLFKKPIKSFKFEISVDKPCGVLTLEIIDI